VGKSTKVVKRKRRRRSPAKEALRLFKTRAAYRQLLKRARLLEQAASLGGQTPKMPLSQAAALFKLPTKPLNPKGVLLEKAIRGEELPTWTPIAEATAREIIFKKRAAMESAGGFSEHFQPPTERVEWDRQERARRTLAVRLLSQGVEASAVAQQANLEFATVKELKRRNNL
jgi:hypothetical protein